jgi:hypothetical protein
MHSASTTSAEIELPHTVECSCGNKVTITREDFEPMMASWTPKEKVGNTLVWKGWWEKRSGWICEQCFEALE